MATKYNHQAIEKKWQKVWQKKETWRTSEVPKGHKSYVLNMFPYPSAQGLHVGHPEGYTASDIVARYLRMKGYNVLHPMGFDSFGLPAENYAIKTGTHPAVTTAKNIKNMRKQIQSLGFSYDWDREVVTSDPKYYKWTQWIFVQLFRHGLAYEAFAPINWCPSCKTGLANEEVVNGKCERCGTAVTKKQIKQWLVKITDKKYIERLLHGLDKLDWPENIKLLQRNWIGRSEGAIVDFVIARTTSVAGGTKQSLRSTEIAVSPSAPRNDRIKVFTTRPDTLFGATYLVLSPEHPLVNGITTPEQRRAVGKYQIEATRKSDLDRTDLAKEKTGVFTGAYAINPASEKKIPIWIADYVLSSYGTGAIMAVPAHDERDFAFAKKFNLPIKKVIEPPKVMGRSPFEAQSASSSAYGHLDADLTAACWTGDGTMVNSGKYDGMDSVKFKEVITEWLHKEGLGKKTVNYKLRDWLFSRQRYWGEPIPIVHCDECKDKKYHYVLIHGYSEDTRFHFLRWVKDELEKKGHTVTCLDLPNPKHPSVNEQVAFLIKKVTFDKDTVVVGHSLGGPVALKLIPRLNKKVAKIVLVEGYIKPEFIDKQRSDVEKSCDWKFDLKKIIELSNEIVILADANYSVIPQWQSAEMAKLLNGKLVIVMPEESHFRATVEPEVLRQLLPTSLIPVPEKDLPLELPNVKKYEPTGTGESPLASIDKWVNVKCPQCGGKAKRETNTMPQWAGSNWYFLRYCDPKNDKQLADPEALKKWLPVDLYVGGAEHAVLHLLYARFIYKFLYDIGAVPKECGEEPFIKLKNQGLILGEDNQKMSKSRGNVVNPDDVIKEFGADAMRMYEMFMGPFEDAKPWNTNGIVGVKRFLDRVYKARTNVKDIPLKEGKRQLHTFIKCYSQDIPKFKFNTGVSTFMEWSNRWGDSDIPREEYEIFIKLLSPFAPHIAEEIWEDLGHKDSISNEPWPEFEQKIIDTRTSLTIPVQINGKVRDQLTVPAEAGEEEVIKLALASHKVRKWLEGKKPKMAKYIKGRIITIAV